MSRVCLILFQAAGDDPEAASTEILSLAGQDAGCHFEKGGCGYLATSGALNLYPPLTSHCLILGKVLANVKTSMQNDIDQ